MRTIDDKPTIANNEGASLLKTIRSDFGKLQSRVTQVEKRNAEQEKRIQQQLDWLQERIQQLQNQVEDLQRQNHGLRGLGFNSMLLDVRERTFLTFLRDRCRGFENIHRPQIQALNSYSSIIHGGNATVDATMFEERRPATEQSKFIHVYGMTPSMIKNIESKGYWNILRVLDAVGGFHLQGTVCLRDEEEILFGLIVRLAEEDKFDEAEEKSQKFPFERA